MVEADSHDIEPQLAVGAVVQPGQHPFGERPTTGGDLLEDAPVGRGWWRADRGARGAARFGRRTVV
ncbi:hypothetical protein ADK64_36575 [Streptomyces sp. MMG1121]|nr:hypothetical protein ADK64_36575 [Streptomyces sp. MMG1121]